jgi:hypothetical protein
MEEKYSNEDGAGQDEGQHGVHQRKVVGAVEGCHCLQKCLPDWNTPELEKN